MGKYIWPILTWKVPLTPSSGKGLAHPSLGEKLSELAIAAFDKYAKEILPIELEADPAFKAQFEAADASRMNHAFLRWQKSVFISMKKIPPSELSWDGSPIPRYAKVPYKWNKFYKSSEYTELRRQLERLATMYLNDAAKDSRRPASPKMRTFIWAEVYNPRDSHRPVTFTGAPVMGTYFARYTSARGQAQKYAFEDPRGINPPFGKTHNAQPKQGEVYMHPAWSSTFLTPHPLNSTNVVFRFICWPPEGPSDFDWEDDATGDFIHSKQFKIKRPQGSPAGGQAKQARAEL